MAKRVLKPETIRANGSYSPGWEVSGGSLIYVAGQLPLDANGQIVAKGDVAGQARQVFANIGTVLAESGGSLSDVIKLTIFLADIGNRDVVNQVRTEMFAEPYPASTQVAVAALVHPDWMVEIEAVAFLTS
jgi:2-iminobutanoate/2-iminopropanoate deaminase